jgi:hypothetical protein
MLPPTRKSKAYSTRKLWEVLRLIGTLFYHSFIPIDMDEQMSNTHMMLIVSNNVSMLSWLQVRSDQNQPFLVQILVQPITNTDIFSQKGKKKQNYEK